MASAFGVQSDQDSGQHQGNSLEIRSKGVFYSECRLQRMITVGLLTTSRLRKWVSPWFGCQSETGFCVLAGCRSVSGGPCGVDNSVHPEGVCRHSHGPGQLYSQVLGLLVSVDRNMPGVPSPPSPPWSEFRPSPSTLPSPHFLCSCQSPIFLRERRGHSDPYIN